MHKALKEISTIHYGKDYKQNPEGDSYPIYGTGGIMGYTSRFLNSGPAVLTGRKGSINRPIYVEGEFWNVDTIYCVKPMEGVDALWIFYNLLNYDLSSLNEATGVPSVSTDRLGKVPIRYVENRVQRKIAEILSTCDEVIEQTEEAIAKYEAIKKGLMHDLFTRGIDVATGQLRPRYEDAPELYKESELGMIPLEWEVKALGRLSTSYSGGTPSRSNDANYIGPIPWISSGEVNKERIFDTNEMISELALRTSACKMIPERSILVAMYGATAGVVSELMIEAASNQAVLAILCNDTRYHKYLYYHLKFSKASMIYLAQGSGQPNLSKSLIDNIKVRVPHPEEVMMLSEVLETTDETLRGMKEELHKYGVLKKGLMQDLLTGKVDVSPLIEEQPAMT